LSRQVTDQNVVHVKQYKANPDQNFFLVHVNHPAFLIVKITFPRHFLLVVLWNQASISNGFRDIQWRM